MQVNGQTFFLASEELIQLCAELKRDLALVVRGELAGATISRLRKHAARMVMVPMFLLDPVERAKIVTKYRRLPEDVSAVLAYVLLLVRNRSLGAIGADLKQ